MVVADSRTNAVRYYLAIKEYMKAHPEESAGCGVMVAFSGKVALDEMPQEKPYGKTESQRAGSNGSWKTFVNVPSGYHPVYGSERR